MIEYINRSLKGVGRSNNEDSVFAKIYQAVGNDIFVAAVCDGMGSGNNGELASRIITSGIEGWFDQYYDVYITSDMFAEELSEPIRTLIININNEINGIGEGADDNAVSTLTLLVLAFRRYFIVQCGDSRAYKLNDSKAERITIDHSEVMNWVVSGEIPFGQTVTSKEKNILTRYIGMEKNFEVDIYKGFLNDDEMLVLCSDGFHGGLDDSCLYKLFDYSLGIEKMVDNAISDKIASGEKDDISVIAVKNNIIPAHHKCEQNTEQITISINQDMSGNIVNLEDGYIYNGRCILEVSESKSNSVSDHSSFIEKNVIIAVIAFVATIALCFVLIILFTMLNNTAADRIENKQNEKKSYVISDNILVTDVNDENDVANDTTIPASETTVNVKNI